MEVSDARMDKSVDAQRSADGYSRFVRHVRAEHLLEALDRAEEELVSGSRTGTSGDGDGS